MGSTLLHRSAFLKENMVSQRKSPLENLLNVANVLHRVFNLTSRDINARLINVEMSKEFDYTVDVLPFFAEVKQVDGAISFSRYIQLFNVLVNGQRQFKADFEELTSCITTHLESNQHN